MPLTGLQAGNLTLSPYLRILTLTCGAVAHLGERYNRTVEARGSSPLSSTLEGKLEADMLKPLLRKVGRFE